MPHRVLAALAALFAVGLVFGPPRAEARFIRPDLVSVPVEQLIGTLTQPRGNQNPKDAGPLLNLARLYAMSYALKEEKADIFKGKEQNGPFFGFTPKPLPFTPKATNDEAKQKKAAADLAKAIDLYRDAIKLAPDKLEARLGLAWCIEQAMKKELAINLYRDLIEEAWKKESALKNAPLGWHPITGEASSYLIPLLDAAKDKEEINKLKTRVAQLEKIPRPVTPIAIPLKDGFGAHDLIDPALRVAFDADGTGLLNHWTWINKDVAWLVYDPQRTGKITSSLQWFGHRTFNLFFSDGYDAMSALDVDGNGWLTDAELTGLALWRDANGDGKCEPGEVKTLAEWGIVGLAVRGQRDASHPEGFLHAPAGVRFRDGTTRTSFDVILQRR